MKIYDISLPINADLPVWPGDPRVEISPVSKIEEGASANVSHLSTGVHVGTHVDAPHHFIDGGATLDKVSLEKFVGPAYVVELPNRELITAENITAAGIPSGATRILFKTHNSEFWTRGETEFQEDFVALSPDAAQLLVDQGIQLVGIDYLSIAPFKNSTPTHKILLGADVVIVEGLDLSAVSPGRYTLYCLPLKLDRVDGAPARAILVEES